MPSTNQCIRVFLTVWVLLCGDFPFFHPFTSSLLNHPPVPLGLEEASAQSVDPRAMSKYEAGLAALQKGDTVTAKSLFKQAIAIDPTDRSVRVGMFTTDYRPNAKLREIEAKLPSAQPLALEVTAPSPSTVQNEIDRTTIQGAVRGGESGVRVSVNGKDVPVGGDGRFSTTVPLNVGSNDITVRASDSSGKGAARSFSVTRLAKEAAPPPKPPEPPPRVLELSVASPATAKQAVPTETESLVVRGSVKGGEGSPAVSINGREAKVESNGSFAAPVSLEIGANRILVRATDASGKAKERQFIVTRLAAPQPAPPLALNITSPGESRPTVSAQTDKLALKGTVAGGERPVQVQVNNARIKLDSRGAFSTAIPLAAGENKVIIKARDSAGKEIEREYVITRPAHAPLAAPPVLRMTVPAELKQTVEADTDNLVVKGSVSGGQGQIALSVNGKPVKTEQSGDFAVTLPLSTGENKIIVKASDAARREDTRELLITRLPKVYPPPALTLASPSETSQTVAFETDKVLVKGSVSGGQGQIALSVNGKPVKTEQSGDFAVTLPLSTGENKIIVKASDAARREDARELLITRLPKVYPPPALTLASPSETSQTVAFETDKVLVKGSVSGGEGQIALSVNGKPVKTEQSGDFAITLPLSTGENKISVKASDAAKREDTRELLITRLPKVYPPPALTLASPSETSQTVAFETDKVLVKGSVSGGEGQIALSVNGKPVKTEQSGDFAVTLPLSTGENKIIVKASDAAKREDTRELLITRLPKVYPPPALTLASPSETSQTVAFETDKVLVKGSVSGGEGQIALSVNGSPVKTGSGGSFSVDLPLTTGENTLTITAKDSAGKEDSRVFHVTRLARVYPPPTLRVTSPLVARQSVAYETETVQIKGSVSGGEGEISVTVNDKEVKTDSASSFLATLPLSPGENKIHVRARDAKGREDGQEFVITRQKKVYPPPVLSIASPPEPAQSVAFEIDKIVVGGTLSGGEGPVLLTVNRGEVKPDGTGSFSTTVPLTPGENRITVVAKDAANREDTQEIVITRRLEEVAPPPVLVVNIPQESGLDGKVNLKGTVNGGKGELRLTVDGRMVPVGSGGAFTVGVALKKGRNRIVLSVEDAKGRQDSQVWLLFHYPTAGKP